MAQGQHSNSAKLEAWLHRAWSHRGLWAHMTWPLSKVLWWLHCMRERLAQKASSLFFSFSNDERGGFQKNRLPVPLVVVGNVFVGGVGKTPLVIALVEHLQAQGLQVGVIARGHGSNIQGVQVLNASSTAEQLGDEPLLVHHRTQAPVVVGVDRLKAAQTLLEHFPQTQVILSDDGLQRLKRWADLVVCVFDERGVGNGWTLPAGPLREPWPREAAGEDQSWVILSQVPSLQDSTSRATFRATSLPQAHTPPPIGPHFVAKRSLAGVARNAQGQTLELVQLKLDTHAQTPAQALAKRSCPRLVAITGIAKPEQFFNMLTSLGLQLSERLSARDHAGAEELMDLLRSQIGPTSPESPEVIVLCTEKDANKLWSVFPNAWCVGLEVTLEPIFLEEFDLALRHRISSIHGHETH